MNKKFIQKRSLYTFASMALFILFIPFLKPSKVNAISASFINCTRTYTQNNAISTNPCNNGSSSTITPVANIISEGQSFFANLNRFTGDIQFSGTSNQNKYNNIRLVVRFSQLNYYGMPGTFASGPAPYIYYVKSDGTGDIVGCPLEIQSPDETRFVCDIKTDNYTAIVAGSFIWGDAVSTSILATIGPLPYNPNSLRLFGLDYDVATTSDPMVAGQNTIISQNDIIINQNQQIIDQRQQDADAIQAASSQGDSNSSQSQVDNVNASQNIFGVVSSVIAVFNTNERNCSIPVVASGVDLGEINFCSGKPPIWTQLVGGVGSIILVYAIYKTALSVFQFFIAMTAFGQGNGNGGNDG